LRRPAGLAAALLLAACAPQPPVLPPEPVAAGSAIRVETRGVGQDHTGAERRCVDNRPGQALPRCEVWRFAGGLSLTSADTSRLHGLSDIAVDANGGFIAVTDEGDLVRGRVTLNERGEIAGVADVRLRALVDIDGRPLSGDKARGDAEGLALFRNGDLMVSFEGRDDILLYSAAGGPPRAVPRPDSDFPSNDGMEALSLDPDSGPDAYLVGREDTRQTWTCRLSGGCAPRFVVPAHGRGKLTSARPLPGGGWVFLLRDFTPLAGNTIWVVITDGRGRQIDVHEIKRPDTVDNFEGVAPVPQQDGRVRLYLVSDDNFSPGQRTLLMAFDWLPQKGGSR
jgi:hypothetical protein